jgi:hypothetical protein
MAPRTLSNMMLVIAVVQIIQAIATGWLAIEVATLRHDLDLQAN